MADRAYHISRISCNQRALKFMTETLCELEAALPRDLPCRLMIVKVYGISGSDHPVTNAHVGLNKGLTFL